MNKAIHDPDRDCWFITDDGQPPADPDSAQRFALVDADWPQRVNDLYLALSDGQSRVAAITDAVQALRGHATINDYLDPDSPGYLDPESPTYVADLLASVDSAFQAHARFRAAIEAQLVPTKNGLIAL